MTLLVIKEYTTREGGEWIPMGKIRQTAPIQSRLEYRHVEPTFDPDRAYRHAKGDRPHTIVLYGVSIHALRFTDGTEWDVINGMRVKGYQEKKVEEAPPVGERYLRVFYCHGCQTCWEVTEDDKLIKHPHIISQEDVTPLIGEVIKASKELATIVVANKIVIDDIMKKVGN